MGARSIWNERPAIKLAGAVINSEYDYTEAYVARAQSHKHIGDYEKAVKDLDFFAKRYPTLRWASERWSLSNMDKIISKEARQWYISHGYGNPSVVYLIRDKDFFALDARQIGISEIVEFASREPDFSKSLPTMSDCEIYRFGDTYITANLNKYLDQIMWPPMHETLRNANNE